MDPTRLRYFSVIARTGSLRAAAELLRLSPAALSKSLKLLEDEVGLKLTVPSGRGLLVTEEGQWLAQKGEALLRELDALPAGLAARDVGRPLRIGSFEVFTTHFLPRLLEHLGSMPLDLHELVPGHLEGALADGQIDIGITYLPIPHPALDHLEAGHVEMAIYARRGAFERPGERGAERATFGELPFVVPVSPVSGSPNRVRGLDGWPEDRFPRNIRYRVTLLESALELCRQGRAVAYLPRFLVELHNSKALPAYQLAQLQAPQGAKGARQQVYVIKRKSEAETSLHRKIAKALRSNSS